MPARKKLDTRPKTACSWGRADDETDTWEGACGVVWQFNEGGPKENGVRFCFRCGGKVQIERPADARS